MGAGSRLLVGFALLGLSNVAQAQSLCPLPLAVKDNRCTFVLTTTEADEQSCLVIGSLARQGGPFRVTVRTETANRPEPLPLEPPATDPDWSRSVQELRARLARARQQAPPAEAKSVSISPPPQKLFYLLTGAGGLQDPANYTAIVADLGLVGRGCQAYVDRALPDPAKLRPLLEEAVHVFDDEIYPKTTRLLGRVLDVDRDGRFTLLFTPRLSKLQSGKVSVDGFVRGSDFYRDVPAPFGNRCDMMYLSTDLRPGSHLRTILAHEYTHAITFCEHVLQPGLDGSSPKEEESWLDEGLAHLAEDLHGYGWSNLDYRVSAFLCNPECYPLVIADYYGSGRWRDAGPRGAAYLFLRWCRDNYGNDLPAHLIQSHLAGIANLEMATGQRFDALFRRWSVALLEERTWLVPRDWQPAKTPPVSRLLCGPRITEVSLQGEEHELQFAGTATTHLLLCAPGPGHARVTVAAEEGADLQVSLVCLPHPRARLRLGVERSTEADSVRLVLTAQGGAVDLQDAAWERLTQTGKANDDTSYRPNDAPGQSVRAWFGNPALRAGETRRSAPFAIPQAVESLIWKVVGKDEQGKPVIAWCSPSAALAVPRAPQ